MTVPIRYSSRAAGGDTLGFSFKGQPMHGRLSDTIASALLANGVNIVGHSFKYRRPRGIFTAGEEEPNAIFDVRLNGVTIPNVRATTQRLEAGMEIKPVLSAGAAALARILSPFTASGFYYKTFMWPHWHMFEPAIRKLAGLGQVDAASALPAATGGNLAIDVCVVGAGLSGLRAAIDSAKQGKTVLVIDQQDAPGGTSRWRRSQEEGAANLAANAASTGVQFWTSAIAFGLYEGQRLGVVRCSESLTMTDSVWIVRAREIVLATGAVERPLLFANNDLPGIMLADAALHYLSMHEVRCGQHVVVATNNDTAYATAQAMARAGSHVTVVDSRSTSAFADNARADGITVTMNARISAAHGKSRVDHVTFSNGQRTSADLIAVSGGWTPTLHLYCQAGGKAAWDEETKTLKPVFAVQGISIVGRAAGHWPSPHPKIAWAWTAAPDVSHTDKPKHCWIDLQNDVTLGDVRLAAREAFSSVEHLKRYTTLGMATDQGKTSNIVGAAALADSKRCSVAALGLTTFRPPYVPVSMAALASQQRKHLQSPIRRLPAEAAHRALGAVMQDYSGVLRPAWYGKSKTAVNEECIAARQSAVALDASSLGKIAVIGPKAGELLDFLFCMRMSNLAPGRIRYGMTLNEAGTVTDDGVVLCLSAEYFVVSCSSSHVSAFVASAEELRQTRFGHNSVYIHDTTAQWATISISGPKSKTVVENLRIVEKFEDAEFPHMSFMAGQFDGQVARVARVSFTGERSYEVSVHSSQATALWNTAMEAGACPIGIEALSVLRAEKGFIYVGQDTDGQTMPHDLGFDAPRSKRKIGFVGDRSLQLPAASDDKRKQLVGLALEGSAVIPAGAHIIDPAPKCRSIGFVTSSGFSPTLNRGVALALIEAGRSHIGQKVQWFDLGKIGQATVTEPCAYDPEGARLHV